jgi:glycyl-tRNA synthetase beta chain
MPELLVELLSEEIPARMQARAAEDFKRLVTDRLKEAGLGFTRADAYVTPRRLALVVDGLPAQQPDTREERKGPRVGAPEQAIQGFLKSAGLASLDQAEVQEIKGAKFHVAVMEKKGGRTAAMLPALLDAAIRAMAWPKSMRWSRTTFRWVRPLHGILAIFDGKALDGVFVLDAESGTIAFGDGTVGHRLPKPTRFTVTGFADYEAKLRNAFVILDPAERRAKIARDVAALAAEEGLSVRADDALLDEVTGLVEWPVVYLGSIDDAYMEVPPEVLITAMRTHQKYFALLDRDMRLAPRFALVANMETADGGAAVVAGNERVLRARLSDAKFFWDQDRRQRLESRVPVLNDIVFHAKLGTVGDKVDRIEALAVEIAAHTPNANKDRVRSAARLAKADLTTQMVGEFPELQGVMGRYYALHDKEHAAVAQAIAEHYSPVGPTDACPTAGTSVAVALADKIDTLVGFWLIGEKPTGSKDPFALRRAALGVIRLVIENGLRLGLVRLFAEAMRLYREEKAELLPGADPAVAARAIALDLLAFFADRLKVHLREAGIRHDLITAVFALSGQDDIVRLLARVHALRDFLGTDDGANLLTAYRRAANIVRIEEKKDSARYSGAPDEGRLEAGEEKALWSTLRAAERDSRAAVDREDFAAAMAALARLRRPVDAFFDKVTVNSDDRALRENRLRLLSQIRATMDQVADFSQIEG